MFDDSLPGPVALSGVEDPTLVGAIEGWARVSAAADARRLAAIAELSARRCEDPDDERAWWACDPTDAAAAEVAAALNVGQGRALGQLSLAVLLRDRFGQLNALFLAGSISMRMVTTLMWRTMLVDDEVLAQVDAALAGKVVGWGPLSEKKLEQAIDQVIAEHDPLAVRRLQTAARKRDITIGDREDEIGTTSVWGRLLATDAAVLKKRLAAMAHGVCKHDPRTVGQRRADALGALAAGSDQLTCLCGRPQCEATGTDARARNVMIHILAHHSALAAVPDPDLHGGPDDDDGWNGDDGGGGGGGDGDGGGDGGAGGGGGGDDIPPGPEPEFEPEPEPEPEFEPEPTPPPAPVPGVQQCRPGAGVILGGAIVPAALLAELIRDGATVRYVRTPGPDPEPHYTPSAKLAEFIRMRDLTCRFPGCDRPADRADVDHTQPWPAGATHPSDLKCFCRQHHHLKTFWSTDGWADHQDPDGTVTITTPAGKTYPTRPASTLLFPGWNITTTASPPTGQPPPAPDPSGTTMPKRKRTRHQDRAYRIATERAQNAAHITKSAEAPPF